MTEESRGGRPRKLTDRETLETLMEVKVTEQLTWPQLADWYEEQYGEPIDHHTIRRSVLQEAPLLIIPGRVSRKVKEAIEHVWEQVDLMKLIMFMLQARFTEWSMLYEKMLRAGLDDDSADRPETFSEPEQGRMDQLWNEMCSFFLRAMGLMKELQASNAPMPEMGMLIWANPGTPQQAPLQGGVASSAGVTEIFQQVSEATKAMLEGVHNRHREEGRGFFRTIEEAEEDLLELDE